MLQMMKLNKMKYTNIIDYINDQENKILIVDDWLSKEEVDEIESIVTDVNFPWFIQKSTLPNTYDIKKTDSEKYAETEFLTHIFKDTAIMLNDGNDNSAFIFLTNVILSKLRDHLNLMDLTFNMIRSKCNLYTRQTSENPHFPHRDLDVKHVVLLYYVNDSDGDTIIYSNKEHPFQIKFNVESKKGRCLLFDGRYYHSSINPTINSKRININFNLS